MILDSTTVSLNNILVRKLLSLRVEVRVWMKEAPWSGYESHKTAAGRSSADCVLEEVAGTAGVCCCQLFCQIICHRPACKDQRKSAQIHFNTPAVLLDVGKPPTGYGRQHL